MNSSVLLQVSGLSIRRDGVPILQAVDWTVRQGEHWVILGANGSGKTSLLKALTGYMTPTAGEVRLLGEVFGESDWRELRKRVGVVSASIALLVHDEDSAWEIVAGGRKAMIGIWGRISAEDRRRALRLLSLVRIRHLAERRWEVLSQGERQRVLIARALMADPSLLILDEPCAGLDPVARERFLGDIQRLATRRHGPSLVFVTHHIEEIVPEFTHLLTLKKRAVSYAGKIRAGLNQDILNEVFGAKLTIATLARRHHLRKITLP